MTTLYIDIETYSTTDIKRGVYRYSEDPEFLVLMAAWAIDDDPTQVAIGHEEIAAIPHLLDGSNVVVRVAHNAQFERVCLSRLASLPVGSYLPPEAWEDTMALMAEWGYPQSLEDGAKALGAEPKDGAGKDLIRWFCQPARNGKRRLPEDHPEKWAAFVEYCRQDVDTMRDMHKRLLAKHGAWPTEQERQVWIADQKVNDRGITVDLELAAHAVEAASANTEEAKAEARAITGVENPNSPAQLLGWFGGLVPDLKAGTVRDALARDDLTADQRRVLELRQGMALTAHKKFQVALDAASPDGRLRGGFRFFGAHTGRWAGRGLQFQNMPRAGFESEVEQDAALLDLRLGLGADPHTLKALVRPMLVGPFTVCDYSAIGRAWSPGSPARSGRWRPSPMAVTSTSRRPTVWAVVWVARRARWPSLPSATTVVWGRSRLWAARRSVMRLSSSGLSTNGGQLTGISSVCGAAWSVRSITVGRRGSISGWRLAGRIGWCACRPVAPSSITRCARRGTGVCPSRTRGSGGARTPTAGGWWRTSLRRSPGTCWARPWCVWTRRAIRWSVTSMTR